MCYKQEKVYFYQKQLLIICFLSAMCIGAQDILIVIIQPQIQQSLGASQFASSFLLGQFHFGMAFGFLIGSSIADRLGRFKTIHHSLVGLFCIGFVYSSVNSFILYINLKLFNNNLLTLSLAIHGFCLGVLNVSLFLIVFESMHYRRNQSILLIYLGRVMGSPIATFFCYFTIEILQASWSLLLAFSSFFFFLLLLAVNFYVKESPLYLWARNESQQLNEFIAYVEDMEVNQYWYILSNRKIYNTPDNKLQPIKSGSFDQQVIGRLWISIPQVFKFGISGFLLYLWGVLQQNALGGDLFSKFKENNQFYSMNYIYFDDLFLHIFSIMVVGMTMDLNRRIVLGFSYALASMSLLFTSAAIYNTWLIVTMIALRVVEPLLLLFTLENYPTYSRSIALGVMLTFQQASALFANATKVVIFTISPRFYYTILTFFLVMAAIISFSMKQNQYDEFKDFIHKQDIEEEEMSEYLDASESSEEPITLRPILQKPLMTGMKITKSIMSPKGFEFIQKNIEVEQESIPQNYSNKSLSNMDSKVLTRIQELNQKYLY